MAINKKILSIVILLMICTTAIFTAPPKTMSIIIKQAQVRSTASNLGKIIATLKYSAQVIVLEQNKDWYKVQTGNVTGWLHSQALTTKTVKLNPSQSDINKAASSDEIYLAGRGFNEEVEKQYKQDKKIDFYWIDEMEKINIPPESMLSFLDKGNLNQE